MTEPPTPTPTPNELLEEIRRLNAIAVQQDCEINRLLLLTVRQERRIGLLELDLQELRQIVEHPSMR